VSVTLSTSMRLCIDIGNTRIKWGVFDGDEQVHYDVFERNYASRLQELLQQYDISSSISSSTRRQSKAMEQLVSSQVKGHIVLDHTVPVPITNSYETPETLGRDRLAGVVAAHMSDPTSAHVVIDAGTCITYDVIDDKGVYLGGNIAPGAHMRLEAMHQYTDGLPLVDMKLPAADLGTTTETAIQNGALRGTVMEMQSFVDMMCDRYSRLNVILTGGDAVFFGELLNTEIFVSPNLIMVGLNEILKHNA